MYNEVLKRRFISEIADFQTRRIMALYFDAIESFERARAKDVYAFSVEELEEVIAGFGSARTSSSTSSILRVIRRYTAWCARNNVEGTTDAASHATVDQTANMRASMVSGPRHLSDVIDILFYPPSLHSTDDVLSAHVWMAFSGLPESVTALLTPDNFSLEHRMITYGGMKYPIYDESIPVFSSCLESSYFVRASDRRSVAKPRVQGNLVLRSIYSQPKTITFRANFSRRVMVGLENGLAIPEISYTRLWLSGVFFRVFERERAGHSVDFFQELPEAFSKQIASSRANMTSKYRNHCIRQYQSDYIAWKQTFYPQDT